MRTVVFVDTSILLNLLDVPGKSQDREVVREEFLRRAGDGDVDFVLPVTAVIETGNHIVQLAGGADRRRCAERLMTVIQQILDDEAGAPWILNAVAWDQRMLASLRDGCSTGQSFVELATSGTMGTGDLAILAERDLFLQRSALHHAEIWTLDNHLAAYGT